MRWSRGIGVRAEREVCMERCENEVRREKHVGSRGYSPAVYAASPTRVLTTFQRPPRVTNFSARLAAGPANTKERDRFDLDDGEGRHYDHPAAASRSRLLGRSAPKAIVASSGG